ncbi:hypothetical protein ATSB10_10790 [Dyella thiooxydans]|uniref:Uncharacterized protein n=1 Tax=Dyella thiooxydans TaxID=445710 RepID=A0A160MYU4_9GAMM|nr:hypothetical protein ATSB10_10790 [Dyella thiooxydans]
MDIGHVGKGPDSKKRKVGTPQRPDLRIGGSPSSRRKPGSSDFSASKALDDRLRRC